MSNSYPPLNNRYQLTHRLGEGGFAITFLAIDLHLPDKPKCVVKKLKGILSDLQTKEYFEREAKVLRELEHHECIPRLLAYFEEGGSFYLVQDYVEGSNLFAYLSNGRKWSAEKVTSLLISVLDILSFIHDRRIIHRDITPGNIILRRDGKLFLIDFGAVKRVVSYRGANTVIGTPAYMAPEQIQGNPKFASDIYSLGILAIQALTGLNPALNQIPLRPKTHEIVWRNQELVSPALANIIDRMVRLNHTERPSAKQALNELKNLENSSQITRTRIVSSNNPEEKNNWNTVIVWVLIFFGVFVIHKWASHPQTSNAPSSSQIPGTNNPLPSTATPPSTLPQPIPGISSSVPPSSQGYPPFQPSQSSPEVSSTPLQPPTVSPPLPDVLESEVGVNYSNLRDYLGQSDWKNAEQETALSMCRVFGIKSYSCELSLEKISKFPCKDLRTIDNLWTKYSNDRFGISVQQAIWQQLQNKGADWEIFARKVGWRSYRGSAIRAEDLIFDSNAPYGHLPFLKILKTQSLLSRSKECSL